MPNDMFQFCNAGSSVDYFFKKKKFTPLNATTKEN